MNILPKKRWHVRTKDNIARVRRDEAEAREKEDKRLEKLKFAESEARLNFLRRQSGLPERSIIANTDNTTIPAEHFDLFKDYKTHVKASNKELEKEQKEEREKYEKQIGYLTYLGQDTNEALKLQSWYETPARRLKYASDDTRGPETDLKTKFTHDPLNLINALLPKDKCEAFSKQLSSSVRSVSCTNEIHANTYDFSKHQKHKKHKKKSKKNKKEKVREKSKCRKLELEVKQRKKRDLLEQLRKERLKREEVERARQEKLFKSNETTEATKQDKTSKPAPRIVQKYNSQFNPELAKQNIN